MHSQKSEIAIIMVFQFSGVKPRGLYSFKANMFETNPLLEQILSHEIIPENQRNRRQTIATSGHLKFSGIIFVREFITQNALDLQEISGIISGQIIASSQDLTRKGSV